MRVTIFHQSFGALQEFRNYFINIARIEKFDIWSKIC